MGKTRAILTVSALNQLIRFRLEEVFPEVWIEGEISNLRVPLSGHMYLTLKDTSSQIRAVIFRSSGRLLKFAPQDGMQVVCRGQISVYEPRGEYQLLIHHMEPRGIGALQLAFEQLKEKLKKEGLFDPNRKRPIPFLPKRIGIVTSPTGAAIRDILKVLHRRFSNMHVLVNPVPVQGDKAAQAIAAAIKEFDSIKGIDVLIVTRGGGSLEDLWAFNEEEVARAISMSRIPVISAIGHEIDYTISDFVADLRAPTPSAAAEMVIQNKKDLIRRIASWSDRLQTAMRVRLETYQAQLDQQITTLRDPRRAIQASFLRLDELESRIRQSILNTLRHHDKRHSHLQDVLLYQSPAERLKRFAIVIKHTLMCLQNNVGFVLKTRRARLEGIVGRMETTSPLAILGRGYSLTYRLPDMRLIKDAGEISEGDRVQVRLHQGVLVCDVDEVRGGHR